MGLFDRLQTEIEAREKAAGLSMADILDLPDDLRQLFTWMMHESEVSLQQVVAHTGQNEETTTAMLKTLVEKGFVREIDLKEEKRYRVRLAAKKWKDIPLDIWASLDDRVEKPGRRSKQQ